MNLKLSIGGLVAVSVFAIACKPSQKTTATTSTTTVVKHDTIVVKENTPLENTVKVYRPSYTRRNDLLHTDINVKFDWSKQHVIGQVNLKLKPLFYPTDSLELDARGFELHKVAIVEGGAQKDLKYKYDGAKIKIQLPRTFTNKEEYTVFIDYTAKPNEIPAGGSSAITSDKGLYFINPKNDQDGVPQQIWTQGETESNSKWFPTIDKPNEKMTHDTYITVESRFKTLSNGLLKESKNNPDGTRTDHWVMDLPHAPYLVMMTVGEFAVVEEKWEGKPMMFYVEPAYKDVAAKIYNNAGEMLTFFSNRLGVKYPWQKMAHVIVREYVSGAMENTTAIIYGDFCQKNARELEDDPNDGIVAHETFHHWFGDLVTCESWSNLSVNESFANYSEYLWFEYKYGKDKAQEHLKNDRDGYFAESANRVHNLIDFEYADKEDMFDAHSYNKGGCTLNMLRDYMGDDAFFAGLRTYLTDNAYQTGEAHQLRLAFEKVTGEDWSWFFNQWYYAKGHPVLDIKYNYDSNAKTMTVSLAQQQDLTQMPVFRLPLKIDIWENDKATTHKVVFHAKEQSFSFPVSGEPQNVNVDPDKSLLCQKTDNKSDEMWAFQYSHAKNYFDRAEAMDALKDKQSTVFGRKVINEALKDAYSGLRKDAISANEQKDAAFQKQLSEIAKNDPANDVRAAAYDKLTELKAAGYEDQAIATFDQERSDLVIGSALTYLAEIDPAKGMIYAEKLANSQNSAIIMTIAELYGKSGDTKHLGFFEKNLNKFNGFAQFTIINNYAQLLATAKGDAYKNGVAKLYDMGLDTKVSMYGRLGAVVALRKISKGFTEKARQTADATEKNDFSSQADYLQSLINDIKSKETNKILKSYYQQF